MSVVLMGVNTTVGFLWLEFGMGGVDASARLLMWVCIPMVVGGAPLGAICGSYLHRLMLAWLVYFIDAAQLIDALPRRLSTAGTYRGGMWTDWTRGRRTAQGWTRNRAGRTTVRVLLRALRNRRNAGPRLRRGKPSSISALGTGDKADRRRSQGRERQADGEGGRQVTRQPGRRPGR